jgi:hypothetical protein
MRIVILFFLLVISTSILAQDSVTSDSSFKKVQKENLQNDSNNNKTKNSDNVIDDVNKWIKESPTNAFSFILNIVMFFLTLFGLYLYYSQKREYRLLQGIIVQFGLEEKIKSNVDKVASEYKELHENKNQIKNQIAEAEKDLKLRLPLEAKKAYYLNSIPVIQKQIFDLNDQLQRMHSELLKIGNDDIPTSDIIKDILSDEIRKHLLLKKELENNQIILAILTGSAAAVGIIFPYPFNLIASPIAFLVIFYSYKIFKIYRQIKLTTPNTAYK